MNRNLYSMAKIFCICAVASSIVVILPMFFMIASWAISIYIIIFTFICALYLPSVGEWVGSAVEASKNMWIFAENTYKFVPPQVMWSFFIITLIFSVLAICLAIAFYVSKKRYERANRVDYPPLPRMGKSCDFPTERERVVAYKSAMKEYKSLMPPKTSALLAIIGIVIYNCLQVVIFHMIIRFLFFAL